MTVPCVILFFAAKRYFVRGIALSGLKGRGEAVQDWAWP